ncbi:MAG: FAD-dependent oxidoreductase [Desulfobacteraceae bacterium]|nr:FAD-dependent oxidoreductase [Desulfobacteraceae bacterium]
MDQDELRKLEERCIQYQPPNCAAACPVHVDVRSMMAQAARGNFTEAAGVFRKTVPFPGIVSRVCDEPCRAVCKRGDVGEPLRVAAIEKACLDNASEVHAKIPLLPKRESRVAIVGGGLSGMSAAFELARKGYSTVVFEQEPRLGGSLWDYSEEKLPRDVIAEDLKVLSKVGVEVRLNAHVGRDQPFDVLCDEFGAVYVAAGPQAHDAFGLARDEDGRVTVDPATLAASREGVFAGGSMRRAEGQRSPIRSISDGRIAATSIDRYLQKVSLTASRAAEGSVESRLYTSTEGVEPLPATPIGDARQGYSSEEAVREASRCLQCQCLECVKVCEYLNSFRGYPKKYIRQIYNNLSIVMGHRHANKLINSCSLCGLCGEVCPEDLHMGLVCRKARETMVEQGRMPPSAHDFPLRDMQSSNSETCAFARHQPGTTSSRFLFFPGCQLVASSPKHVRNAYALLMRNLSEGVGFMSRCCGAPAQWSGRVELFEETREDFLASWRALGSPLVIAACSTCHDIFRTHLSEVPVVSLWETLDNLGLPEREEKRTREAVAVHDACTARHATALQASVRSILGRLGLEIEELPLSREKTECCGYGGLMFFANPELAKSAIRRRIEESPRDYLTYCAMCRDYLAFSGKRALHLLDLIFDTPWDEAALRKGPTYSQRRENRVRLKNGMLRELWGESTPQELRRETIRLRISDDVQQLMEDRLILIEDLQQVIDAAERSGYKLLDPVTGHFIAHDKPAGVTYWVEYSAFGNNDFLIHNAYSHRMEITEDLKP